MFPARLVYKMHIRSKFHYQNTNHFFLSIGSDDDGLTIMQDVLDVRATPPRQ